MTNIFETTEAIFVSNVLLGLANDMPRNAADRMMIVTRHIALEIKGNMRLFPITRQLGSLGEASMTSRHYLATALAPVSPADVWLGLLGSGIE